MNPPQESDFLRGCFIDDDHLASSPILLVNRSQIAEGVQRTVQFISPFIKQQKRKRLRIIVMA